MRSRAVFVAILVVSVAISGTANNFAGRIKAKLFGDYNFVCILPDSVFQLLFNMLMVVLLVSRRRISQEQFAYIFRSGPTWQSIGAWKYLAIAGVNDVANNVTGLMCAPYLSTFMMSLMDQATTPFTVVFSALLLRVRYNLIEIASVIVVLSAAIFCVTLAGSDSSQEGSQFWAIFAAATTSFAALSFVLKEITFENYAAFRQSVQDLHPSVHVQLSTTGPTHDRLVDSGTMVPPETFTQASPDVLSVFLVGAVINLVGLLTSVPIALITHASVGQSSSWQAFVDGLHFLFSNEDAFVAYVVYICVNTAFNVSLILTTSHGSALLSFLSLKAAVPLTAIFSALPWPVIGSKPLDPAEWGALIVLLGGLSFFRIGNIKREQQIAHRGVALG